MKHIYFTKGIQLAAVILLVIFCMVCRDGKYVHGAAIAEYVGDTACSIGCEMKEELLARMNEKEAEAERKAAEEGREESKETSQPALTEEERVTVWDGDYKIIRELYQYEDQQNSIHIYYPRLTGFAEPEKEERINALIEDAAKRIIGVKNKDGDFTLYCVSLDYEIMFWNEEIVSILYQGHQGYITTGHSGLTGKTVPVTIDIKAEKKLFLQDVVTDIPGLGELLLADEFEHITKWDGSTEGYEISEMYEGQENKLAGDLMQRGRPWYTDGEDFMVVTTHMVCDYNEYSIPIRKIRPILNGEFLKKLEAKTVEKGYVPSGGYCSMEELGEMDYYLFCDTRLHKGVSAEEGKPSIINNSTQTIEEAKELYQRFKEKLPLEDEEGNGKNDGDEDERTEVVYISPDCKWVKTDKWSEHQTADTMTLFFQKEKVKEKTGNMKEGYAEIALVKDGDAYKEVDEAYYRRLSELEKENLEQYFYSPMMRNAEGDLIAGITDNRSRLTVRRVEDGTEQWSFDLQGIQRKVRRIRDDIGKESIILVFVEQFVGNEQEGWLVIQAGRSSFFRIAYPSGEVTYLGEYLYSPCFSPDGKYMAYSCVDYDNGVDMEPAEYEQTPPDGIYVWEVGTEKTGYIYWHPSRETGEDYMEYRNFMWVEREGFEEYMADTGGRE